MILSATALPTMNSCQGPDNTIMGNYGMGITNFYGSQHRVIGLFAHLGKEVTPLEKDTQSDQNGVCSKNDPHHFWPAWFSLEASKLPRNRQRLKFADHANEVVSLWIQV